MFTGIITAVANVKQGRRQHGSLALTIATPKGWRVRPGESIATDGVCLTVTSAGRGKYTTTLMPETLAKTTFGKSIPQQVNLERALKADDALGGHLVMGHVDTVGTITKIIQQGLSRIYRFSFPKEFALLAAPKGSIAIDGISLTIVNTGSRWCTAAITDHTFQHTTIGSKWTGDFVNLEFDIIAKYVARFRSQNI